MFWMRAGMLALAFGTLSMRFTVRIPGMTEDRADAISGLFYGIAIASLLLSLRGRGSRVTPPSPSTGH
jgi:hypothetical protein